MGEGLNKYALRKSDIRAGDPRDPNFGAIYVDGKGPIELCFAFYLDEGRVGTYDTRGDGNTHFNESGDLVVKWLTGKIEIKDRNGTRWV